MVHNGSTYFYRKNAQGDIISLLDNTGEASVYYRYNAWGVCTVLDANGVQIDDASHIGNLNPFRYRSYYYDTETGFYFLKTRYYDPEICRFITIDDISYLDPDTINGLNLYAYCLNNPVMFLDETGQFVITFSMIVFSIVFGAVVGGLTAAISSAIKGDTWYEIALKTLSGAALGGVLGAAMGMGALLAAGGTIAGLSVGASITVGMATTVGGSAVIGAGNSFISQIIDNDWDMSKVSGARVATDALAAGIKGLLGFAAGAWTGASGLWNAPEGAAPGFLNLATKTVLNISIGTGWKLSVDAIYAKMIGEECGWINALKAVMEWIF